MMEKISWRVIQDRKYSRNSFKDCELLARYIKFLRIDKGFFEARYTYFALQQI